jgi:hypothetical protein
MKCVLSKMMVTTWLIFPRDELIWQDPAELVGAAAVLVWADAGPLAHADVAGYIAKNAAVTTATICRHQLRVLCILAV